MKIILVFFFRDLEGVAFCSGVRSHRVIFILKNTHKTTREASDYLPFQKGREFMSKHHLKNLNKSCLFS